VSALGQKQTFCDAGAMSALPPKATIDWKLSHVHFVPEAVIRLLGIEIVKEEDGGCGRTGDENASREHQRG
jgi:hypothetical protein